MFVAFASVRQGSCYLHAPKVHLVQADKYIIEVEYRVFYSCVRLPVMSPDRLLAS